ncbi:hypothetical protein D1114_20885 [Cereibacter sphaeroides]|uniref:Transcriptional regulator n=1 Tax=Cereibacter sphaeroides TaxID=1063 RepID=A0AAX1UFH3_CERSP|nr:hypothetical protein [Cereibacter sphaeroides]RHZ91130.1 hypothetical protein D1114_20885 [Cereibacter sphaeroides]
MHTVNPIENLIASWPTRRALASEIGANVEAVHKWAKAGRIPADWQAAVVKAAAARGIEFATAEWMISVHARPEEQKGAA